MNESDIKADERIQRIQDQAISIALRMAIYEVTKINQFKEEKETRFGPAFTQVPNIETFFKTLISCSENKSPEPK